MEYFISEKYNIRGKISFTARRKIAVTKKDARKGVEEDNESISKGKICNKVYD